MHHTVLNQEGFRCWTTEEVKSKEEGKRGSIKHKHVFGRGETLGKVEVKTAKTDGLS